MKPIRILVLTAGLIATVWVLASLWMARRPAAEGVQSHTDEARSVDSGGVTRTEQSEPARDATPAEAQQGVKQEPAQEAVAQAPAEAGSKAQPPKAKKAASGGQPKEPLQDPMARTALSFVGADPVAEAYWYEAINDPSLPPNERKDLIEDLNEDGISDPKHPGVEDLPLIVSRLALLEEVAFDAMDQVNADAFEEAYKDLVNMYGSLTRGR